MEEFDKKRLFWARVTALSTVCILVVVLTISIGAALQFRTMQEDFAVLSDMALEMEELTDNLITVSANLEKIDWEDLAENINLTAEKALISMDAGLTAIDELDIETLNEAIINLRDVIEPLARFFNSFN
ncbi:MAG: hypothetical protein GX028_11495 [Clostridiaceae bacterium]|nr:hypothetical protein [Clostridiaceae bacterium]